MNKLEIGNIPKDFRMSAIFSEMAFKHRLKAWVVISLVEKKKVVLIDLRPN